MSAAVIALPTSAPAPVSNPRKRGPWSSTGNVVSPQALRFRRANRGAAAERAQRLNDQCREIQEEIWRNEGKLALMRSFMQDIKP